MIDRYQLPLDFPAAALRADLGKIAPSEWIPHFNKGYYDGDWSGIVLRGASGRCDTLHIGEPFETGFVNTPVLDRCECFQEVIAAFECSVKSVRLLRLSARSVVREHRDYDLGYEAGEIRLHVPVLTNSRVEFYLRNRQVSMGEGEVWYLDLGLPHRVANLGETPRIHLVLDLQVNDWLRSLIPFETPGDDEIPVLDMDPSLAAANLEKFRERVRLDLELQRTFSEIFDRQLFAEELVRVGRATGYDFNPRDVEEVLRSERRAWNAQWTV
ncbi:MAG TPA: aspartyl/asparaginyl beta-hydroxylase domain-containing protein [Chthoniobacterales bacterium]